MRVRVRAVVAVAALVGTVGASPARADRATADRLAAEAAAAAANNDLAGAAAKFRAAYAAEPLPELQCNAGVAYYKLGDLARADRYLGDCANHATGLAADFLAQVHAALAEVEHTLLERDVTPVDFAVEPATATVTVDLWPDEPIAGAHRVWLAYGHHQLAVAAPGYVGQTVAVEAASHESLSEHVTLVAAPAFVSVQAAPPPPSSRTAKLLVVTGGVLAVAGVGFHIAAEHVRGELADATTSVQWHAHNGDFEVLRGLTIGCYAAAAVTGAIGGYLLYRHAHEHQAVVGIGAAPGGATVEVTWWR